jgi:hypothetical protein
MNRKMIVSLCLVVNATVALSLSQSYHQRPSLTSAVVIDDGTQPPVPPKGPGAATLIVDGTQPPVPPKGPGAATLIVDGTQPPVPPKGPGAATLIADGTQPPVPPKGPGTNRVALDGTQPPPGRVSARLVANAIRSSASQQGANGARLAALTPDGTQPPVPPKGPGQVAQQRIQPAAEMQA